MIKDVMSRVILGIDPGIATLGWGLVKDQKSKIKNQKLRRITDSSNPSNFSNLSLIDFGCIKTPPEQPMPQRLKTVYRDLKQLIKTRQPSLIAIEKLFFGMNAKTAMTVGQARGIILLSTADFPKIELTEIAPLSVKNTLTGYGRTDKNGMKEVVAKILKMKEKPKSDDAADALAVAICAAIKGETKPPIVTSENEVLERKNQRAKR